MSFIVELKGTLPMVASRPSTPSSHRSGDDAEAGPEMTVGVPVQWAAALVVALLGVLRATGDLAGFRADGEVEFLGPVDSQDRQHAPTTSPAGRGIR
ncbi:hypothetical protein [Pseudofrankia sp. BMG5.37]|uniref:hypothetical protein n=1 Tax=Pseudofrankia sp. BMG5.37 TaxID=3050035 RepID=UPI002893F43E|nr:hypothetical protein [Pseudofrankia sp. BMG5.37]MDT3439501.1 hypothetical protein [Pseudofrankia sp. BMG5.37]